MRIGELAAQAGVNAATIRYYERLGLVPKPARTPAGYRQYTAGMLRRLVVIRSAKQFGFSLKEIAAFLRVREAGGAPCHEVRAAAGRILIAVDQQIAELVRTRRQIRDTLKDWDRVLEKTPADQPARLLERLAPTRRT